MITNAVRGGKLPCLAVAKGWSKLQLKNISGVFAWADWNKVFQSSVNGKFVI